MWGISISKIKSLLDLKNASPITITVYSFALLCTVQYCLSFPDCICVFQMPLFAIWVFPSYLLGYLNNVTLLFPMKLYFIYFSFHFIILLFEFSFTSWNFFRCLIEVTKQSFPNSLFHEANLFQKDFSADFYTFDLEV